MYIADVHEHDDSSEIVEQYLSEGTRKKVQSEIGAIVSDEFDRLEQFANDHISDTAARRAEDFLGRVLAGDKDAAMALLGDRSGGSRYRTIGYDAGKPWASLIHGRLFETDGIRLRRQIVEAHAELLRSERIADLESIIAGLTRQVQELDSENRRLAERMGR